MFKVPEQYRVRSGAFASDESYENNGMFHYKQFIIVASDGEGWEHVSVSLRDRTPTWEEMCEIKNLFWGEDDTVIQYHPAKSAYVNNHNYCLHMWRPIGKDFPVPPSILVGLK